MLKKPEIIVVAGPNGSGKSTVIQMVNIIQPYINADDIKAALQCTALQAAQKAEKLRNTLINRQMSFTFETVLSTSRNIELLKRARKAGFFIRCIYVLTIDPQINIIRVRVRKAAGGHDVPQDKIISRYKKALAQIPQLLEVCDICHIYDNSDEIPFRIFKKRKDEYFYWEDSFWNKNKIEKLINNKSCCN
ncbi:zeta toxin family protein [Pectinatus frisingensis]|uniref:zeta toxin family protein n=1 Tax=Pectinatus frisingensis TaxID=865 RepID=UPI0018C54B9E|nr:zeta toxin family protein [Pectinatus frisingensis]